MLRFLQCDLNIPKNGIEGVQSMLPQLREVMIEGNTFYSIINPLSHNPNLTVDDVLTFLSFPLEEQPFAAVINFQTLTQILETAIHGSERRTAHVFITPPDKSATVIQDKEHACLFDSRSHQGKGATIIVGNVHQLHLFCLAVESMLKRDWNKTFEFTNFSQITLT